MTTTSKLTYKKSTPGTHVYENRDDPYVPSIYVRKRGREKPKMFAEVTIRDYDAEEEMTDDHKTP